MNISGSNYSNSYSRYFNEQGHSPVNQNMSGLNPTAPSSNGSGNAVKADDYQTRMAKQVGKVECETCKSREYQDGSNDPGVSFKTPGHIDPNVAGSVVMSHEREHVKNESAKASGEGREVVSQSISLQTSTCPECGKVYVSGGKTVTVTKGENSGKDLFLENFKKFMDENFGRVIDTRV